MPEDVQRRATDRCTCPHVRSQHPGDGKCMGVIVSAFDPHPHDCLCLKFVFHPLLAGQDINPGVSLVDDRKLVSLVEPVPPADEVAKKRSTSKLIKEEEVLERSEEIGRFGHTPVKAVARKTTKAGKISYEAEVFMLQASTSAEESLKFAAAMVKAGNRAFEMVDEMKREDEGDGSRG